MSDSETVIGDKMMKAQLKEYSNRLGISIDDLIELYIRRGLFVDDYYVQPKLSEEKLQELFSRDDGTEKREIDPKYSMDSLIGIYID